MLNENPLISVIVPVYKVEQYLHRCIDSILAQTYTNLEIILVDDGSPDRSGEICDEYATKDSRIRVIHKENGGVSSARNVGLDVSTGDYIAFADPDDYLTSDMYKKMIQVFDDCEVDICVSQWQYECADGTHVISPDRIDASIYGKHSAEKFAEYLYRQQYESMVVCVVWNKLYRRCIFNDIRFLGKRSEDERIHTTILCNDYTIMVLPDLLYVYCQNFTSITHKPFDVDSLLFLDVLAERVHGFNGNRFIVENSCIRYCEMYIGLFYEAKKLNLKMRDIREFDDCLLKITRSRSVSLKFLIRMLLFRISPALYAKIKEIKP